jgi:hypothetical protein
VSEEKPENKFLKYGSLGIQMVVTIGMCGWLGWQLDRYAGFQFPLFLLLFVFLSFGGMMYRLYRAIQ